MTTPTRKQVAESEKRRQEKGECMIRPNVTWVLSEHEDRARADVNQAVKDAAERYKKPSTCNP